MGYYEDILEKGVLNTIGRSKGGVTKDRMFEDIQRIGMRDRALEAMNPEKNENIFTRFWNAVRPHPIAKVEPVEMPESPKPGETLTINKPVSFSGSSRWEQGEVFTPYEHSSANFRALDSMSVEKWAANKEYNAAKMDPNDQQAIGEIETDFSLDSLKERGKDFMVDAGMKKSEPGQVASFDPTKGSRASNLVIGGLTSGLPIPGSAEKMYAKVNPQGIGEKLVYHGAEIISAVLSIGGISRLIAAPVLGAANPLIRRIVANDTVRALETRAPKLFRFMTGKESMEPLLQETAKLLPSLMAYGQFSASIDSPLSHRLYSAARSIPDSLIFSRFSLMTNLPAAVGSQAAYGVVAEKLAGGSDEDALVQGAIFGALGAWMDVTNNRQGVRLSQKEMEQGVLKQAEQILVDVARVPESVLVETPEVAASPDSPLMLPPASGKMDVNRIPHEATFDVMASLQKAHQTGDSKTRRSIEELMADEEGWAMEDELQWYLLEKSLKDGTYHSRSRDEIFLDVFENGLDVREPDVAKKVNELIDKFHQNKLAVVPTKLRAIETAVQETNQNFMKALDAEKALTFIEETNSKPLDAFEEFIAKIHLGDEASREEWHNFKLSRQVQEMFAETDIDHAEFLAGYTEVKPKGEGARIQRIKASEKEIQEVETRIAKETDPEVKRLLEESLVELRTGKEEAEIGSIKLDTGNKKGEAFRKGGGKGDIATLDPDFGSETVLFDRADVLRFLLDVPLEGKDATAEGQAEAIRGYFPNEKDALKFYNDLRAKVENGEPLSGKRASFKVDEPKRKIFQEVMGRFSQTDGSKEAFFASLIGKTPEEVKTLSGFALINDKRAADRVAHRFNKANADSLYQSIRESNPQVFRNVERTTLAKDLVKSSEMEKVQYSFTESDFAADEAKYFKKENVIVETPEAIDKRLYGRKEIVEDFVDRLDIAFRKARLPKNVKGRALSDQIVELKTFDSDTAFHESGHILDARFNITENISPEFKKGIMEELQPFLKNLEDKYKGKELGEGFARFVSHYVLGQDGATKFPVTTDFFENYMQTKAPEFLDAMKIAKSRFQDLINAPELAAAKAEIYSISDEPIMDMVKESVKNPGRATENIKNWLRNTYRDNLNVFSYFKDVDKAWDVKDTTDSTYYRAYTSDQRIAGLVHFVSEKGIPNYRSWKAAWSGEGRVENIEMAYEGGLAEIYKDIPVEFHEDVDAYRKAAESVRRFERAQKDGRSYATNPLFTPQRAFKIMQQVEAKFPQVGEVLVKFDRWYAALRKFQLDAGLITPEVYQKLQENPMYAHLNRIGNIFDNDFESFKNLNNTILKRSVGSQRGFQSAVIDDITEVNGMARQIVENEILQHLYFKTGEQSLKQVQRGQPDIEPIRVSKEEVLSMLKKMDENLPKGYLDEVSALIDENPEILTTIWRPSATQGDNVRVKVQGEVHYLRLDKNLQDALGLIHNNNMATGMWRYIQMYTKMKRLLATSFSLNFTVRNPVRDTFTAYFQSEKLFVPGVDSVKGLKHVLAKDDIYWRGVLGGLEGSSLISSDISETMRNFNQITGKVTQGWASRLVDTMYSFAQGGEMATRFGVLGKYDVKNPQELAKGIMDARETTFNWSQRGTSGNFISSWNKLTAFFKAHLVVMDKEVRTLANKPGTVFKRGLPFMAFSMLLANAYKDDLEYQNLPVWRRLMTFNFKVGDKWLFIPLPGVYGLLFVSTPQLIYSELQKKDANLAKEFAMTAINQLTPVAAGDAIPDLFKPVLEGVVNTNLFTMRKIEPEHMAGLPPEMRMNEYTSDNAVAIAQAAQKFGLNWSPMKIDHYLRGYLVSAHDVSKAVVNYSLDTAGIKLNEFRRQYEVTDAPVISGFLRREYEPASEYQVSKLTDKYKSLKTIHDGYLSARKVNPEKGVEWFKAHQKELSYFSSVEAQYEAVKNYITLYSTIQKSEKIPDAVKEARLKGLKDVILNQALVANDIIEINFGL